MRIISTSIWPLIFIGQLLATSLLAWHLLAQINFAYPTGYALLGLDKHIAEFAPLNRHKHGFEFTKPNEHWALFAQITHSVQHHGQGLADINYTLPNGTKVPLMHTAEIIHLEDVSHLIDRFYLAGTVGGLVWILGLMIAYRQRLAFPSVRNILLGFCGGIFIITTLILLTGPTRVFYWLHTKVFPEGHQWFFYYEDSLMTTLMKAPDIFAFIALLLLGLLVILWGVSTFGMATLVAKNSANTHLQSAVSNRKGKAQNRKPIKQKNNKTKK